MAGSKGIDIFNDNGMTIIMDDTFLFQVSIENMFILVKCVCNSLIGWKYHLIMWKLQNSRWIALSITFIGAGIQTHGSNIPVKSKDIILKNWTIPAAPREILGFIGLSIFLFVMVPVVQVENQTIVSIVDISPHYWPQVIGFQVWQHCCQNLWRSQRPHPCQTYSSACQQYQEEIQHQDQFIIAGIGFCLTMTTWWFTCISGSNEKRRQRRQLWIWFFLLQNFDQNAVFWGSQKMVGNIMHCHSHPAGESRAVSWEPAKNRHFL